MYNKVVLVGNLTRDIDIKYTASNLTIANTGIATSRKFKNQMGEDKEEVVFVDITFFGRTAEVANQYLKRGSKILIDGRLKLDQWTDASGQKRSKHSVTVESMQMLGSKPAVAPQTEQHKGYGGYTQQPSYQPPVQKPKDPEKKIELEITEENIPF